MEEDDIVVTKNYCPYASDRSDWDTYCTKSGNCQYKKNVRDCDGDIISLCRM